MAKNDNITNSSLTGSPKSQGAAIRQDKRLGGKVSVSGAVGTVAAPVLLTRQAFREAIFARDDYRCVMCEAGGMGVELDPHHLIERRLWTAPGEEGGYFLANGATLCADCHMAAEETRISVEEIRAMAGITRVVLPSGWDPVEAYDKWANVILPNGRRLPGPLFHEEPVQKVLGRAGLLRLFDV